MREIHGRINAKQTTLLTPATQRLTTLERDCNGDEITRRIEEERHRTQSSDRGSRVSKHAFLLLLSTARQLAAQSALHLRNQLAIRNGLTALVLIDHGRLLVNDLGKIRLGHLLRHTSLLDCLAESKPNLDIYTLQENRTKPQSVHVLPNT